MVAKTSNGRVMLLSEFAVWNNKKSRFIKKHVPGRLLSQLEIMTLSGKVPLLGDVLFWGYDYWKDMANVKDVFKVNILPYT